MHSTLFRSSHLFFYIGIALVLLSLFFLPAKIKVGGTPEQVDVDYYSVGWLYAPTIGSYGLASLVFGILEVSITKKETLPILSIFLIPILILISLWTLFIVLTTMVLGFNAPFWWLALIINIIPSIAVLLALFIGVKKKEFLVKALEKKSVKIAVSIITITLPLIHIAFVLQSSVLVWAC